MFAGSTQPLVTLSYICIAVEAMTRVGKTIIRRPRWFLESKRKSLGLPSLEEEEKENRNSASGGRENKELDVPGQDKL